MELWRLTSCGRRSCESVDESTLLIGRALLKRQTQTSCGGKIVSFWSISTPESSCYQSQKQPRRDTNRLNCGETTTTSLQALWSCDPITVIKEPSVCDSFHVKKWCVVCLGRRETRCALTLKIEDSHHFVYNRQHQSVKYLCSCWLSWTASWVRHTNIHMKKKSLLCFFLCHVTSNSVQPQSTEECLEGNVPL